MELNFNVLPRVIVEDEIRPCVGMTSNFFLSAADIRPFADRVSILDTMEDLKEIRFSDDRTHVVLTGSQ